MRPVTASVLLRRLLAKGRLRHMQVLVRLGELGSLKRAAEALDISQPAVTQLLADLERLVEAQLYERHARGVRPTAAGEALLPLARRVLETVAAGSETLAALRNEGEGVVRMAAITGVVAGLLTRALPALAAAYPRIQLQVAEMDATQWAARVAQGDVDLVGCRAPPVVPEGWRFVPLLSDRFVVACGPRHPLAGRKRVDWTSLARETWLLSPVGSAARGAFDRLVETCPGPVPVCQVVTRVSSLTTAMLRSQRLLTLVPLSVVRPLVEQGQLALVGASLDAPFADLGLLVPQREPSAACASVLEFLQGFAAAHP